MLNVSYEALCHIAYSSLMLWIYSKFIIIKTVVRTVYGNSKGFEVKVGMQGSGISPLLFVIVMEAISREFRVAVPWEMMRLPEPGN